MQARRYNPFGGGVRNCLGQQLARMNVPTAVAMFVSNFHLKLTPEVLWIKPAYLHIMLSAQALYPCHPRPLDRAVLADEALSRSQHGGTHTLMIPRHQAYIE